MALTGTTATLPKTESLVEAIESKTKRWVTIDTLLTDNTLTNCNAQLQSPLFQLPKELRDLIFEYSCCQSPDTRHQYGETTFYYRPGYTARPITYTSLLLTCRKVWLEANDLPMREAEHCFYFQRGPFDPHGDNGWSINLRHERDRYVRFLRQLTPFNLRNFSSIHLFMQMFQAQEFSQAGKLEMFFSDHYIKHGLKPKIFHITIRQSDWWDWESDKPLEIDHTWVQALLDAPRLCGVEEFRLELETLASKEKELWAIVQGLQKLEGKSVSASPADPRCLRASAFVVEPPALTWQWSRSSRLDYKDWPIFGDTQTLKLLAVIMRWRRKPTSSEPGDEPPVHLFAMDQSPPETELYHTASRASYPPSMALQNRSRRALFRDVTWNRPTSFPWYRDMMCWSSVEHATKVEDSRRDRFARIFGDIEAKRLIEEWKANGSLLKFGGIMQ